MSFQPKNNTSKNTNVHNTPFGRYNNTWEEVFDTRRHIGLFLPNAVKLIYGSNEDSFSSSQLADYIRKNQLTLNWSIIPGIDATHHCFVNGPWDSPFQQVTKGCGGPTMDVPLNETKGSFQRFIMNSVGYNASDSLEINFLNYKADMQLLYGYQKRYWAKHCILRIRLPSFYQLTGQQPDDAWSLQLRNQTSPVPTHCPDFVPIVPQTIASARDEASPSPKRTDDNNPTADERSSGDSPQFFNVIRATKTSLFVKLANNEHMPEIHEVSKHHKPLYLTYDPVSNEYGYWIGRSSYLANKYANNFTPISNKNSTGDSTPRFVTIRESKHSLFVKLSNNEHMPATLEVSRYHKPLYLTYDPVSKIHGYWIGRNSYLAYKHT